MKKQKGNVDNQGRISISTGLFNTVFGILQELPRKTVGDVINAIKLDIKLLEQSPADDKQAKGKVKPKPKAKAKK